MSTTPGEEFELPISDVRIPYLHMSECGKENKKNMEKFTNLTTRFNEISQAMRTLNTTFEQITVVDEYLSLNRELDANCKALEELRQIKINFEEEHWEDKEKERNKTDAELVEKIRMLMRQFEDFFQRKEFDLNMLLNDMKQVISENENIGDFELVYGGGKKANFNKTRSKSKRSKSKRSKNKRSKNKRSKSKRSKSKRSKITQ